MIAQVVKVPSRVAFGSMKIASPDELLSYFEGYLKWCEDYPLYDHEKYGKEGETMKVQKMRTPTLEGFSRYLRIPMPNIKLLKDRGEEYIQALTFIDNSIHAISYEGAAAGIIKESIVTRKLGLAERVETSKTERVLVILSTPDNYRSFDEVEEQQLLPETSYERAEVEEEDDD